MQTEKNFALHGHIVYTSSPDSFQIFSNHYLICQEGKVGGIYSALPEALKDIAVYDYCDRLIIPGLCDTHVHAPQYAFRGLGMDRELIDWLNIHAFPEELLYENPEYAQKAYSQFAEDLKSSATTRAAVFATVHIPATLLLMRLLEESGLCCFVGKVSMDRNAPSGLLDPKGEEALAQTESWIVQSLSSFRRTKPILTPRFVPACTDELLAGLGELARKYNLPVQSHLSENKSEIELVRELCPWSDNYADVYRKYGLLDNEAPAVMAHCVYSDEQEQEQLRKCGALVSHCPSSNANLSSGIAPIKQYLNKGIQVSLGTDIGAGFDLSVFRAMTDAVQMSKIRAAYGNGTEKPLTLAEAFYMGTKGASPLFGKVGSFEPGYMFDAVVIDDHHISSVRAFDIQERLERAVYLEKEISVQAKFVDGRKIL